MRRSLVVVLAVLVALACASPPGVPSAGLSEARGQLRLVPREGVKTGPGAGSSYGDRRLRDVEFVDYTRPGFAVVYVSDDSPPAGELVLAIRTSHFGARFEPELAAVGAAGRIVVHNDSAAAHLLSYPAAGVVRSLAAGERLEVAVPRAGEQGLYVLDQPDAGATVFAAPGRFDVVSSTGRFRLKDLAPGSREIRAWHPRFPAAVRRVELAPDASVPVDFELGVGRDGAPHAD